MSFLAQCVARSKTPVQLVYWSIEDCSKDDRRVAKAIVTLTTFVMVYRILWPIFSLDRYWCMCVCGREWGVKGCAVGDWGEGTAIDCSSRKHQPPTLLLEFMIRVVHLGQTHSNPVSSIKALVLHNIGRLESCTPKFSLKLLAFRDLLQIEAFWEILEFIYYIYILHYTASTLQVSVTLSPKLPKKVILELNARLPLPKMLQHSVWYSHSTVSIYCTKYMRVVLPMTLIWNFLPLIIPTPILDY